MGSVTGLTGGLLSPAGGLGASGLLGPLAGLTNSGASGLLAPAAGVVGSVTGLTGGLLGSPSNAISSTLGGLGLGGVSSTLSNLGGTVNGLPLVGQVTAPLGLTNLQNNPGGVAAQEVPSLVASLGGGKYLTSTGAVVAVPQERLGQVGGLVGGQNILGQAQGIVGQGQGVLNNAQGGPLGVGSTVSGLSGQAGISQGVAQGGLSGVTRYIQIGGQVVPLNAAGQIIGLSDQSIDAGSLQPLQPLASSTPRHAQTAEGYLPVGSYLSDETDPTPDATSDPTSDITDPTDPTSDITDPTTATDPTAYGQDGTDALSLVAQAMSGGEASAHPNEDEYPSRKGWEVQQQRTASHAPAFPTPTPTSTFAEMPDETASVTASETDVWTTAVPTGGSDDWGQWVSATAEAVPMPTGMGGMGGMASGTSGFAPGMTSSAMMPQGSAGLS